MKLIVAGLSVCLLFVSCKKNSASQPPKTSVITVHQIHFEHEIDGNPASFDTITFVNASGQVYSINSLSYYFSRLSLIKPDSSLIAVSNYYYVNARNLMNTIDLNNIEPGNFIGIKGFVGLDSTQNKTNFLPPTVDNTNMQWPDPMGGGYHFLKLEGYYKNNTTAYGYAMHLGTNKCLVPIVTYKNFTLTRDDNLTLHMVMNVNEWFRNPYVFNFNTDGNYIMGNDTAMMKIATNGKDVFVLK